MVSCLGSLGEKKRNETKGCKSDQTVQAKVWLCVKCGDRLLLFFWQGGMEAQLMNCTSQGLIVCKMWWQFKKIFYLSLVPNWKFGSYVWGAPATVLLLFTTVLSQWDFFHGKVRLPSLGKASCDSVVRPNLGCMLNISVFLLSTELWHGLSDL